MSFVIREKIRSLHGARVLKRSALSIRGGAHVFERVMSGKGFGVALEIGTYRGCAAAEMAQYCRRVVTIDLKFGKLERDQEKFDRLAFWASLGISNIEFHAVNDDIEKRRLIDSLIFDIAFIDGSHDASVANDFDMVKRCGRVLFHDYDKRGRADKDHVFNFINSLPSHQIEVMDIFALWTDSKNAE